MNVDVEECMCLMQTDRNPFHMYLSALQSRKLPERDRGHPIS